VKIIKSENKEWQGGKGYSKKILFKPNENSIVVQEVKIGSGETAKSHYHKKQTEVFYFLNDNGYWLVNNEKIEPRVGEVLIIEPNDRHEVVNNSSADYIYLALKYNYEENDSFDGS